MLNFPIGPLDTESPAHTYIPPTAHHTRASAKIVKERKGYTLPVRHKDHREPKRGTENIEEENEEKKKNLWSSPVTALLISPCTSRTYTARG